MTEKSEGDEKEVISRLRLLYFRPLFIVGVLISVVGLLMTVGLFGDMLFGYGTQKMSGWLFTVGVIALAIGYSRAQLKKQELEEPS